MTAPDGCLWIAKFPAHRDKEDIGAWEMVVHELAAQAGLNVPAARLEKYSDLGSTFLVKRFDHDSSSARFHYASALTLLGKIDGASSQDGSSYLELAEFIFRFSIQ